MFVDIEFLSCSALVIWLLVCVCVFFCFFCLPCCNSVSHLHDMTRDRHLSRQWAPMASAAMAGRLETHASRAEEASCKILWGSNNERVSVPESASRLVSLNGCQKGGEAQQQGRDAAAQNGFTKSVSRLVDVELRFSSFGSRSRQKVSTSSQHMKVIPSRSSHVQIWRKPGTESAGPLS